MKKIMRYLELARPDNWIKNLLIIPGFFLAYLLTPSHNTYLIPKLFLAFVSVSVICSANYIINEWLDRDYDKFHPTKKFRSSVVHSLQMKYIFVEYFIFIVVGLSLALLVSIAFSIATVALLLMGIVYNVKPMRTKDITYIDVISESINNPLRFLLGWLIVSTLLPPLSFLIFYWMGGAYVMGMKRYAELKFIQDPLIAAQYRRSFKYYTPKKLLVSSLFYATCSALFLGAFIMDAKKELIILFPLYAILFSWYLFIGLKQNSIAQRPELIYKEKYFTIFTLMVIFLSVLFLFIDIK